MLSSGREFPHGPDAILPSQSRSRIMRRALLPHLRRRRWYGAHAALPGGRHNDGGRGSGSARPRDPELAVAVVARALPDARVGRRLDVPAARLPALVAVAAREPWTEVPTLKAAIPNTGRGRQRRSQACLLRSVRRRPPRRSRISRPSGAVGIGCCRSGKWLSNSASAPPRYTGCARTATCRTSASSTRFVFGRKTWPPSSQRPQSDMC